MKAWTFSSCRSTLAATARKTLSAFLAITLVFLFPFPERAFAETAGDGTAENPVIITTEAQPNTEMTIEEIMASLYEFSMEEDSLNALDADGPVVELYGTYEWDTAASEALHSFSSSEYAIIASGVTAVDALSATALAGALDCPILLASTDYLPSATTDALKELGVNKPILVGGPAALTNNVERDIALATNAQPLRLAGNGIIDTQIAIFEYGRSEHLWGSDCIVAQGILSYADALSFAPIAYKLKAPIFLTDEDGLLPNSSQEAFVKGDFDRALIGGGNVVVSPETEELLRNLLQEDEPNESVIRLGGLTLYDTSTAIAQWAVESGVLTWDNAAFATGRTMTDSLAGCAVQGRDNSVMLLIDEGYYATLDAIANSGQSVSQIKIFGGPVVVTERTRVDIANALGLEYTPNFPQPSVYSYDYYSMSTYEFAQMEVGMKVNSDGSRSDVYDILDSMDPTNFDNTTSEFMEFVNIGAGYSGISAETMDNFIAANCVYSESRYGATSNLRGIGSAVVEASQTYGVNEAYLLAHAIIESAWGCSELAQGWIKVDGEWVNCGYLNFFGIGAFDSDPQNGASFGRYYGWDSPRSAMLGGAYWISRYYIHSDRYVTGDQNTLWKMAWDANYAQYYGTCNGSHQYATSRSWAINIALTMDRLYTRHMGRYFDFDELGIQAIIPVFND